MKLIIISPEKTADTESAIVNRLFQEGMERFHLRKPHFTLSDYRAYIESIDSQFHSCIVIHHFFELHTEYQLGGVHLNSVTRAEEMTSSKISLIPARSISTSFHSWPEVEENDTDYAYIFISPVFDSISKTGYKAGIDLPRVSEIKGKLRARNNYCPGIIGLGGVGENELEVLHCHGFDGAAALGAVWLADSPVDAFRRMNAKIKRLKVR